MDGAMYWSTPMVESRRRLAPRPNSRSGPTVTTPDRASRTRVQGSPSSVRERAVGGEPHGDQPAATGISSAHSRNRAV